MDISTASMIPPIVPPAMAALFVPVDFENLATGVPVLVLLLFPMQEVSEPDLTERT